MGDTHPLISYSIDQGVVSVSPLSGFIPPGGFCCIRIRLNAKCNPKFLQHRFNIWIEEISLEPIKSKKKVRGRLQARLDERKKAASLGKGHHDTILDKPTTARSFHLDNTSVPDDREAALPTSKSEPPPPGPEGSPVKAKSLKNMSYKERSKLGDPEALSFGISDAKSVVTGTEFSDDRSRAKSFVSTANKTNDSIIPEGRKQLLNLFLFGEVVREESFKTLYANFEVGTFEKTYIP